MNPYENQIKAKLPEVIDAMGKQGYSVQHAYLTESPIWTGSFGLYIQTNYPRPFLPTQDLGKILDIIKAGIGPELYKKIDDFVITGSNNPFTFRNNAIVNPNTGDTYQAYWYQ